MTLTKHNIEELLPMCSRGNQVAQLEVYNRYYKAMFNTALRIVKNTAEAEDVMQEAFLNAFTKIDTFKGDATFGSWLKRIVVNKSLSAHQKMQRLGEEDLDNHLNKLDNEDNGISSDENQSLQVKKVMQALNSLNDNYRIALTLNLIEGYDYEEMGQILNMSYANCRTTVSRAKTSLRNLIAER